MLRSLTLDLVEHGRIKTTTARAKQLRPFVEPLVTKLKDPTLANIRFAHRKLGSTRTVMGLSKKVAPVFKDRKGGYLRILKLARPRVGDCADMAFIEWVDESLIKYYEDQKTLLKASSSATPKKKASKKKKPAAKAKAASPKASAKSKVAPVKPRSAPKKSAATSKRAVGSKKGGSK